jgi:prepilin-type N-terminal cleavage/methylation domain-containing protein
VTRWHSSQRGFTLIEIAIAMAVLGLCVVSALQIFGGSMRLARNASRMSEAVVHAKALMDSALWQPRMKLGVTHKTIGNGFRWERTVRLAGAEDGALPTDQQSDLQLVVVSVTVEWDEPNGTKAYTIGTMRIAPIDEG